eukprot:6658335-Alexandrium_andersonii.AAC.1
MDPIRTQVSTRGAPTFPGGRGKHNPFCCIRVPPMAAVGLLVCAGVDRLVAGGPAPNSACCARLRPQRAPASPPM